VNTRVITTLTLHPVLSTKTPSRLTRASRVSMRVRLLMTRHCALLLYLLPCLAVYLEAPHHHHLLNLLPEDLRIRRDRSLRLCRRKQESRTLGTMMNMILSVTRQGACRYLAGLRQLPPSHLTPLLCLRQFHLIHRTLRHLLVTTKTKRMKKMKSPNRKTNSTPLWHGRLPTGLHLLYLRKLSLTNAFPLRRPQCRQELLTKQGRQSDNQLILPANDQWNSLEPQPSLDSSHVIFLSTTVVDGGLNTKRRHRCSKIDKTSSLKWKSRQAPSAAAKQPSPRTCTCSSATTRRRW